jgi:hypothetical protein
MGREHLSLVAVGQRADVSLPLRERVFKNALLLLLQPARLTLVMVKHIVGLFHGELV